MIAVITGDIIRSEVLPDQRLWREALAALMREWELSERDWGISRGDTFQVRLRDPLFALKRMWQLKARFRSISLPGSEARSGPVDARMALGLGEAGQADGPVYTADGPAFVRSGRLLERMKDEGRTMAVGSPWPDFDRIFNVGLRLASVIMDGWTIGSAEVVALLLADERLTQKQLGARLGIGQNAVSQRLSRAHFHELMELEQLYRDQLSERCIQTNVDEGNPNWEAIE